MATTEVTCFLEKPARILKWKVSTGTMVSPGKVLLLYKTIAPDDEDDDDDKDNSEKKLRARTECGRVTKLLAKSNEVIQPGQRILLLEGCTHPTVIKDLCAECGIDLREESGGNTVVASQASVPIVHSVPELKVCPELAVQIGKADKARLLRDKKLALLVDLDQTIVHTTNDDVKPDLKDVYHYKLPGQRSQWYHTRLRPNTRHFLSEMSSLFELHICTFGVREYAHTVAALLDNDGKLFSHRILSRDECFDPGSKYPNLKALFPCGDDMVCIIDDREDVWQGCGNLVQVKPYYFFRHTANIDAPPGMNKLVDTNESESSGCSELPQIGNESESNDSSARNDQDGDKGDLESEESIKPVEEEELGQGTVEKGSIHEEISKKVYDVESISDETNEQMIENEVVKKKEVECKVENKVQEKEEQAENREPVDTMQIELNKETKKEILQNETHTEYEDQDDYLLYLEDILRRIHKEYYTDLEKETDRRSLKDIIPRVRARVLKGLTITFSGLIPTHQKLHQSRAYKVARTFGAQVTQDLTEETTHLVAMKPGTQKVNVAKKRADMKIVNPDWLWTCAERWEHVDERLFPLTAEVRGSRIPPPHCSNPEPILEIPVTNTENFANTINPLFFVSKEQIYDMDKEVEENMSDAELDPSYDIEDQDEESELILKREHESSDSNDSTHGEYTYEMPQSKRKKTDDSTDDENEDQQRCEVQDNEDDNDENDDDDDDDDDVSGRFRRGEGLPEDLDLGDNSVDSLEDLESVDVDDDREWNAMGAALEREFLSD